MKLHPRVSQAAVDLVKRFEGFRPRAARTPDGRFTIGYGHILSPRDSVEAAEISEPEAEFLLKHDLSNVANAVEEALLAPVNENQFAALLSFAFNIGLENFKGSSAVRHLNQGAYLQAAAAIELWRRADFGGDTLVVDQLVRRRAVEKALFLAPPEGFMPLPSSVLRPAFDHSVIGAAVAWAAARERTAVSRLALEGPEATADLAVPPGHEGEPAPSAAIAAADALAVRLSRILPEDEHHAEPDLPAPPPPPLTLEAEPAPPEFSTPDTGTPEHAAPETRPIGGLSFLSEAAAVAADAPPAFIPPAATPAATAATPRARDSGFDLPPPPAWSVPDPHPTLAEPASTPQVETAAHVSAFDAMDFGAPVEPSVHFEAAEHAAEPPPFVAAEPAEQAPAPVAEAPVSPWRRRFSAQPQAVATAPTEEPAAPSLFDAPPAPDQPVPPAAAASAASPFEDAFEGAQPHGLDHGDEAAAPAPTPLFERPLFFVILGLLGIALFAGSIFCMMNRASFTCLLIGVVGVLAMAPAAAFFLFRFLGKPVDPASEEHASLSQIANMETAPDHGPAEGLPAAANDSPFDSAWR